MKQRDYEWEKTLYYDRNVNKMTDEEGNVLLDIFRFISPNIYNLFKTQKKDMLVRTTSGKLIGLIYP